MATLTTTLTAYRTRRFSLSLVSAKPSPLLNLPAELVLDILESVLSQVKPSTLSTISKVISRFVDIILYRTVVLHSKESLILFHRTTLSRSPAFFASHVKKLVVAYKPHNAVNYHRAQRSIAVCGGARSLLLSMWFGSDCLASVMEGRTDGGVSEITLHSTDGIEAPIYLPAQNQKELQLADIVSDSITHLRICEPGEVWVSPEDTLLPFGALLNLTHLQLSRRTNSNSDNDLIFQLQVRSILQTHPALSVLAVVIYPQLWAADEDVSESDIWVMMHQVAEQDGRLRLVEGKNDDWATQWRNGGSNVGSRFWADLSKCSGALS
ncbi:hypothetical protein J3R30DRAFT_3449110 [Lentinula aciculospora]|uniref:Uncharacterized protein n=1 Tax=Lentinula aciculospora TaxID=153920 RepID=A0A9W9DRW7_9AGAR|nr:hypothetical protein J3R30DRAFT_3449110 [Lentinula aciculospora]